MIKPQPESDLSLNVIVVGADVIKILKKHKEYLVVEDLLKKFLLMDDKRAPGLFFDTLTFLYALGIIREDNYKVRLKYDSAQKTLF